MNKNWGSPDLFSFRRAKFTPTPSYFEDNSIYNAMECTFKKSGINNLKVLFSFHRFLYNLLEKKNKKMGVARLILFQESKIYPYPHIFCG